LSGLVTSSAGFALSGATAVIVDGPDANKSAVTDGNGRYAIPTLLQAGFTVRVTATGYVATSKPVTLTANTVVDFQLSRLPVANLIVEGGLIYDAQNPDGTRGLHGIALNNGDACAGSITGTTTLNSTDGSVKISISWTLRGTTLVRPGDRVQYPICCLTNQQLQQFGQAGVYGTQFSFVTVTCP
jgi:hypothetical protein